MCIKLEGKFCEGDNTHTMNISNNEMVVSSARLHI